MYLFFRLLNLVALLSIITGIILKAGHWFDSSLFLCVGIAAPSLAYLGKLYWDYRNKSQHLNRSLPKL